MCSSRLGCRRRNCVGCGRLATSVSLLLTAAGMALMIGAHYGNQCAQLLDAAENEINGNHTLPPISGDVEIQGADLPFKVKNVNFSVPLYFPGVARAADNGMSYAKSECATIAALFAFIILAAFFLLLQMAIQSIRDARSIDALRKNLERDLERGGGDRGWLLSSGKRKIRDDSDVPGLTWTGSPRKFS